MFNWWWWRKALDDRTDLEVIKGVVNELVRVYENEAEFGDEITICD